MNNGIPDCIHQYIELETCEKSNARFGVQRLIDRPEISRQFLADVAGPDFPNARQVFESALRVATSEMLTNFNQIALPYLSPLLANTCLCTPPKVKNKFTFSASNVEAGAVINFTSPEGSINVINHVYVMVEQGGPITINLDEAGQISTFTANVATGGRWQKVDLFNTIEGRRQAGGYRLKEGNQSVKIYHNPTTNKIGFFECRTKKVTGCCSNKTTTYTPPKTIYANVQPYKKTGTASKVAGIWPCISIKCDPMKLLCVFAENLAPVIICLVTRQLLLQACNSDNINPTTLKDEKKLMYAANNYGEQARVILEQIAESIKDYSAQKPSGCFVCTKRASTNTWVTH